MSISVKSYTQSLTDYIQRTSFDDLPAAVVRQAKAVLLDTIGCMLAATAPDYRASALITDWIRTTGGSPDATIMGMPDRSSTTHAALANGTLANNIELDDSHPLSGAHVATVVVPAALAVAEHKRQSGRNLLLALAIGYDVDVRLVLAMNPSSLYQRGFHPSAVCGGFGAAAAAGKLMGLSSVQLTHALSLAGSLASGLMAWETDPTQMPKSLQMGIAASNGVMAASLAAVGFCGPADIIGGRYGVVTAFSDAPDWHWLTHEWGTRFEICHTGLKKYACCRFLHAALDAFLAVRQKHNLALPDIQEITMRLPAAGAPIVDRNELLSHNAQYVLAVAARDGNIMPHHIYSDQRSDPLIGGLMDHVFVVADDELTDVSEGRFSEPAIVRVTLRDGQTWAERSDYASGDPEKPLSERELLAKFYELATPIIPIAQADRIVELIQTMDALPTVTVLTDCLSGRR